MPITIKNEGLISQVLSEFQLELPSTFELDPAEFIRCLNEVEAQKFNHVSEEHRRAIAIARAAAIQYRGVTLKEISKELIKEEISSPVEQEVVYMKPEIIHVEPKVIHVQPKIVPITHTVREEPTVNNITHIHQIDIKAFIKRLNWIVWLLALLTLLSLVSLRVHAQDGTVRVEVQSNGTRLKRWSAGTAIFNCTTGLTCSYDPVLNKVNILSSSSSGDVTHTGNLISGKAVIGNGTTDIKTSKVTITDPLTSSTLTIQDGFTLTVSGNANVSGTNSGDQTTISGNAGTATALATPRNINGIAFDGTVNITIPAVTSIATASPISGGTITSTGTIGLLTNVDFSFTTSQTITRAPASNTSIDGLLLVDSTAATSGNQQRSPRLVLAGQGWKTNSTAASQDVRFAIELRPTQGSTAPDGTAYWLSQVNTGTYQTMMTLGPGDRAADLGGDLGGLRSVNVASSGGSSRGLFGDGGLAWALSGYTLKLYSTVGAVQWGSGDASTSADSDISRVSAGLLGIGSGAAGSFAGNLKLTDLQAVGNLIVQTAGKGLQLQSGTGARAGDTTLVGGTITVTNTTVTANTKILLTRKTSGGTIGTAITYTVNAGASFTINSDNILDTSTFTYLLVEVN
jgi:hypothetical protein